MQHFWPTTSNIVGCYMLHILLHAVAIFESCCAKLKLIKLLAHENRHNIDGSCCVCLHVA